MRTIIWSLIDKDCCLYKQYQNLFFRRYINSGVRNKTFVSSRKKSVYGFTWTGWQMDSSWVIAIYRRKRECGKIKKQVGRDVQ